MIARLIVALAARRSRRSCRCAHVDCVRPIVVNLDGRVIRAALQAGDRRAGVRS